MRKKQQPPTPNRLATNSAYRLNPQQCPNCHANNCLDGQEEEYEARSISQHVVCNKCGHEWDEIYELTHYENLVDAAGKPVEHDQAAYTDEDFKHPHPDRYPIFTESASNLPPGIYLALYNGWRDYVPHSHELLDDMGFNGPLIGPLAYCQTTYGRHIKMEAATGHYLNQYFPIEEHNDDQLYDLDVDIEGYVWHDGCDYGDWVVIIVESKSEQEQEPPAPGTWTADDAKRLRPEVLMVVPGATEEDPYAASLEQDPHDPDKAIVTVTTTDILLVPWVNVAAAINANRPLTESDEFDMAPI